MSTGNSGRRSRLPIEVEPELRQRIEEAATQPDGSVRRPAPDEHDDRRAWSALSAPSFARDWQSDADAIYGDPA
jgi:hypothetical protein